MHPRVEIRDVIADDIPLLYENAADPAAIRMAAFTSKEAPSPEAFAERIWQMKAKPGVMFRTIDFEGKPAGSVGSWDDEGQRHVTYWIRRELWGEGIATAALRMHLQEIRQRPVYSSVVADNVGSIRVLEKCGFKRYGSETAFAEGRGEEVTELLYRLDAG